MRYQMISSSATNALAREYQRTGDDRLVHQIVEGNRGLAIRYVQRFSGFEMLPHDDLYQQADLALIEAARRFDPDKKGGKSGRTAKFSTYAWQWLNACVLGYIVKNDTGLNTGRSGNLSKVFFGLSRAESKLAALGIEPTDEAVATELDVKTEIVMALRRSRSVVSFDAPIAGDFGGADLFLSDAVADENAADPSARLERDQLLELLEGLDATLKPDERFVIRARYSDDCQPTFTELGRRLSVSRETVRLVERRALAKLRGALERGTPARMAA